MIIHLIAFILGAIIGSFLNCVIYRMEVKKSFIKGRSFCPHCKKELQWYDLIPILSFLFLGGKCRYCKKDISIQYPLVELGTGLVFLLLSITEMALLPFLVFPLLIVIFIYDLKHFIIPDSVIFPLIILSFFIHLKGDFILSGFFAGFFFFLFWLLSKGKWMGFGDVKLALFMGFFLGFPNIIVAMFTAFCSGAVIGLFLILFKNKKLRSEVPFAPFLIFGTFIGFFFGSYLVNFYFSLL